MKDFGLEKKLSDEVRYIKDLLDSKENELEKLRKENKVDNQNNYCNCSCCCDIPIFEWEDEEERDYSEYDDEIETIPSFKISIEVECEDKNFESLLKEIIIEKVDESLEEYFGIISDEEDDCEVSDIKVNIDVNSEDEDLAIFVSTYINDEINELIEEAIEEYYIDEFDEECDCEVCQLGRAMNNLKNVTKNTEKTMTDFLMDIKKYNN